MILRYELEVELPEEAEKELADNTDEYKLKFIQNGIDSELLTGIEDIVFTSKIELEVGDKTLEARRDNYPF